MYCKRIRHNILSLSRLRLQGFRTSEEFDKLYFPDSYDYLEIILHSNLFFIQFNMRDVFERIAGT